MGFLHKLWDETLAGPTPESGLGKLRKYNSFSASRTSSDAANPHPAAMMGVPVAVDEHLIPISRSITIIRGNSSNLRNGQDTPDSGSVPSSPAASNTPTSPLSSIAPGHSGNFKMLTRRKSNSAALQQEGEPKSPTGYDWIVLSALDR